MSISQAPSTYLSFSRLNVFNNCGRKYKLSYLDGAPRHAQGAFIGGTAIHKAIEISERNDWWIDERDAITDFFLEKFDELLADAGGRDEVRWAGRKSRNWDQGEDDRWWRSQGPAMLRRYVWIKTHFDKAAGVQLVPGGIEIHVQAVLPSGMGLQGYVDALLMVDSNGERFLRDWKSGQTGRADPLQLASYAWMLQHIGVHVTRGQFTFLRTNDPTKLTQNVDISNLVPLVPELYDGLAQGIEAGVFNLKPSPFCKSCSVRESCSYGSLLDDNR